MLKSFKLTPVLSGKPASAPPPTERTILLNPRYIVDVEPVIVSEDLQPRGSIIALADKRKFVSPLSPREIEKYVNA